MRLTSWKPLAWHIDDTGAIAAHWDDGVLYPRKPNFGQHTLALRRYQVDDSAQRGWLVDVTEEAEPQWLHQYDSALYGSLQDAMQAAEIYVWQIRRTRHRKRPSTLVARLTAADRIAYSRAETAIANHYTDDAVRHLLNIIEALTDRSTTTTPPEP